MPRIDPTRFHELVQRRDQAKVKFAEATSALKSAGEAEKSAERQYRDAESKLDDYVRDCSGDPKPERFNSRF